MSISKFSNDGFGNTDKIVHSYMLYLQSLDGNLDVSNEKFLELIKNRCGAISIDINSLIHCNKGGIFVQIDIPDTERGALGRLTTIRIPSLQEAIPSYQTPNMDNFLVYLVLIEPAKSIFVTGKYKGNISEYRQLLNMKVDMVPFRPLTYKLSSESDLFIKNGISIEENNIDNFIPVDFMDEYYALFIPINKMYRSKKNILETLKCVDSTIQIATNFYINI